MLIQRNQALITVKSIGWFNNYQRSSYPGVLLALCFVIIFQSNPYKWFEAFDLSPFPTGKNIKHSIRPGKTTTISRTGVRETCVSRYHGDPIKDHAKTPQRWRQYCTERFNSDPQSGPIMPRGVSPLVADVSFFSVWHSLVKKWLSW